MEGQRDMEKKTTGLYRVVLDPGNLMLLIYTLVIGLMILCGGLLPADAAEHGAEPQQEFDLDQIRRGELLVPDADGAVTPALQLGQDVRITVSGIVARVRVVQSFRNSGPQWVDGVYVFPLPDESAVDRLKMVVGEREIVGVIKEKEEARAIYEEARSAGKKTSLLAQNRPNIFTTRIANIGPGETVEVVIEYQQQVRYLDGIFSLRFPMTITPRYTPGQAVRSAGGETIRFSDEGWAADTDRVPDASQVSPPVAAPSSGEEVPVRLTVDLMSGFPVERLESLYHRMKIERQGDTQALLTFTGEVLADRDFVLEWQPVDTARTSAILLGETFGEDTYLLLMLMPPHERYASHVPREAIFVLDISGSMAGLSIVQAKSALREALTRLDSTDRFNVITFNDSARSFFEKSVAASPANVHQALGQLETVAADGGTEMREALELALDGKTNHERIRQVIFLTDGAVSNERELLALIHNRLGDSRLFTIGIGSAPNSYFMSRAATLGRGSHTAIGDVGEVKSQMNRVLTRLASPALTDLRLTSGDGQPARWESYPAPLPDLYYGEPLVVALKTAGPVGRLQVGGNQNGTVWQQGVDAGAFGSRPGIAALWARKKIRSEMESLALGRDEAEVKKAVLETALAHRLVSRYTSLVAVDDRVTRPEEKDADRQVVKSVAPYGLELAKVFGGSARTATPAPLLMVAGLMALIFAGLFQLLKRRYL